jgi:hypothetical protein
MLWELSIRVRESMLCLAQSPDPLAGLLREVGTGKVSLLTRYSLDMAWPRRSREFKMLVSLLVPSTGLVMSKVRKMTESIMSHPDR